MRRLWVSSTVRSRPSRAPLPGRKAKKLRKLLSTKFPGAATRNARRLSKPSLKRRRPSPEGRTLRLKPARSHRRADDRRERSTSSTPSAAEMENAALFRSACFAHSDASSFQITGAVDTARPGSMPRSRKRPCAVWNCSIGQCRKSRRSGNSLSTMVRKDRDQPRRQVPTSRPTHLPRRRAPPKPASHRPAQDLAFAALETPYLGARKPIGSQGLEAAITQAVKNRASGCENFVGVIVQRTAPKSPSDANWSIRGVRFGGVSREEAGKALSIVVARMQQEFSLSED